MDFGLSGLAKQMRAPWEPTDREPRDVLSRTVDLHGGDYALGLLEDVLRLRESALADDVISTVWQAAGGGVNDLTVVGTGAREWLTELADTCVARLRRHDPGFEVGSPAPSRVPGERVTEVMAELRAASPALDAETARGDDATPVSGVPEALEQVVTRVDAGLGFRLFLRAMKSYTVPVTEAQSDRLYALERRLGYEDVVDDDCLFVVYGD
ncbi:hypothetical protein AB0E06_19225 [Streptomyces sp. NPDC048109]|uniref:hypothetical protein n=1 Tax=unclassified Streptomyces TaxID=2593676 RepID=UPI0033DC6282